MSVELITGVVIVCACVVGVFIAVTKHFEPEPPRHGAQPLTGAGPKPRFKTPHQPRAKVRPTARRMRSGGTAYMLRRNDYATDLLFLIALDAALDYDEMYYADAGYMDSPFLNDEFDYGGSDFEDYAEQDSPPPPVEEDTYEKPEATTFEDLSSDDDPFKTSWGGSDAGNSDWGGSDDGGGYDNSDSYDSGGGDDW